MGITIKSHFREHLRNDKIRRSRARSISIKRPDHESGLSLFSYFLFPRPCRLVVRRRSHLASQLLVSNVPSDDLFHGGSEALTVVHVFPVVVAESLLVKITEQVEGLDADVGSVQAALLETPKVLHRVGMHVAVQGLYR